MSDAAQVPYDRSSFRSKTLGPTYIATVAYSDVEFQEVQAQEYVKEPSREGLMLDTFQRWKDGQVGNKLII